MIESASNCELSYLDPQKMAQKMSDHFQPILKATLLPYQKDAVKWCAVTENVLLLSSDNGKQKFSCTHQACE